MIKGEARLLTEAGIAYENEQYETSILFMAIRELLYSRIVWARKYLEFIVYGHADSICHNASVIHYGGGNWILPAV